MTSEVKTLNISPPGIKYEGRNETFLEAPRVRMVADYVARVIVISNDPKLGAGFVRVVPFERCTWVERASMEAKSKGKLQPAQV